MWDYWAYGKKWSSIAPDGSLSKLEYRCCDLAGIAVRNGYSEPEIFNAKGKLKILKEMTNWKAVVILVIYVGQYMASHMTKKTGLWLSVLYVVKAILHLMFQQFWNTLEMSTISAIWSL